MKKISLIALISAFVILATMLTGCTPSATPTGKELRFSNEKFVFNISLERSAQVDNEMVVKDGTTETKYVEDYQMLPYNYDEIRPVAAKGVLTVEINTDDTAKYTLTTSQTIYAIYNKSEFTDALLDSLTAEQSLDINGFNAEEQQLQIDTKTLQQYIDEGKVALRSVTDTYTEFEAKKTQQPLKSTKALTGYYLGYSNQQYSQYTTESEYNYENGATVKVTKTTDGKESISNHQLASNTIDINQYILYSRTLDKGENTFGDNPSVQVFDPFSANYRYRKLCNKQISQKRADIQRRTYTRRQRHSCRLHQRHRLVLHQQRSLRQRTESGRQRYTGRYNQQIYRN